MNRIVTAIFYICLMTGSLSAFADSHLEAAKLANLGLEELMEIEVSSVSRRDEKLSEAPAAVFVLTSDDLRRSGATSVPEALRLVPGVSVARMTSNTWAVTARGFNGEYSNKLLVLIDGRSVYTPLFSGVFWDVEEVPLSQIERIEVIRGPGATLWGANAVNGVINIITKSSRKDQGFAVEQVVGNIDRSLTTLSYSGLEGEDLSYRVYGNFSDRSGMETVVGEDGEDAWSKLSGGLRTDWEGQGKERFMLKMDGYKADVDNTESLISLEQPPFFQSQTDYRDMHGGSITARWSDQLDDALSYQLQTYVAQSYLSADIFKERRNTIDFDSQFDLQLGERNHVLFGFGYRNTSDKASSSGLTLTFSDEERSDNLFSAFLQDDITLIKNRLRLILGSKFENNDYTGFELQPSARFLLMPYEQHTFWASIARAVRTPSRVEHTVRYAIPGFAGVVPPGTVFSAYGDEDFESEDLVAYEAGYRAEVLKKLSLDTAFFVNRYDGLRTAEMSAPVFEPGRPFVEIPAILDNKSSASTAGLEVGITYHPRTWLKWRTTYSLLKIDQAFDSDSTDPSAGVNSVLDPENQVQSWLALDFGENWEGDFIMYYVDALPSVDVPSHIRFDARLGYKIAKDLSLSLVVQNLFDSSRQEFSDPTSFTQSQRIERSYYGMFNWRY